MITLKDLQEGRKEAHFLGLNERQEYWTPLMKYIHFTRIGCGCILGFLLGVFLVIQIILLIGG